MTHVATKALGLGIDKFPQLNGNIAFGNVCIINEIWL